MRRFFVAALGVLTAIILAGLFNRPRRAKTSSPPGDDVGQGPLALPAPQSFPALPPPPVALFAPPPRLSLGGPVRYPALAAPRAAIHRRNHLPKGPRSGPRRVMTALVIAFLAGWLVTRAVANSASSAEMTPAFVLSVLAVVVAAALMLRRTGPKPAAATPRDHEPIAIFRLLPGPRILRWGGRYPAPAAAFASTSVFVLMLLLSLGSIGVVQGLWSKNVSISGVVETGDVNADWDKIVTQDRCGGTDSDDIASPQASGYSGSGGSGSYGGDEDPCPPPPCDSGGDYHAATGGDYGGGGSDGCDPCDSGGDYHAATGGDYGGGGGGDCDPCDSNSGYSATGGNYGGGGGGGCDPCDSNGGYSATGGDYGGGGGGCDPCDSGGDYHAATGGDYGGGDYGGGGGGDCDPCDSNSGYSATGGNYGGSGGGCNPCDGGGAEAEGLSASGYTGGGGDYGGGHDGGGGDTCAPSCEVSIGGTGDDAQYGDQVAYIDIQHAAPDYWCKVKAWVSNTGSVPFNIVGINAVLDEANDEGLTFYDLNGSQPGVCKLIDESGQTAAGRQVDPGGEGIVYCKVLVDKAQKTCSKWWYGTCKEWTYSGGARLGWTYHFAVEVCVAQWNEDPSSGGAADDFAACKHPSAGTHEGPDTPILPAPGPSS